MSDVKHTKEIVDAVGGEVVAVGGVTANEFHRESVSFERASHGASVAMRYSHLDIDTRVSLEVSVVRMCEEHRLVVAYRGVDNVEIQDVRVAVFDGVA